MTAFTRNLLVIALLAALGWVLWELHVVLIYVIISMVLALMGKPMMLFLGRFHVRARRMPLGMRAGITLTTMMIITGLLLALLLPPIFKQGSNLAKINTNQISTTMNKQLKLVNKIARRNNIKIDLVKYVQEHTADIFGEENITGAAGAVFEVTTSFIVGFFSVAFITFFLLKDDHLLSDFLRLVTPSRYYYKVMRVMAQVRSLLTRYFIALVIEFLIVSMAISLVLWLLDVENFLLLGFAGGLLNIIPFIGPWMGAALGILFTLLSHLNHEFTPDFGYWLLQIGATFVIIHFIDSFFIQPALYSNSVRAHPLEIFIVILCAGTLAGIGGMVLAIPVYTILRVVAREFYDNLRAVILPSASGNLPPATF